jgi:lipopolysaccharide/colanic/teichoic acid biosynthesis glycosyltransferase
VATVAGDVERAQSLAAGVERPRARRVAQRTLDVLVVGVGIVVLSPLMLVLAVLVRATSPGPALFRQTRLGQYGRRFRILKFRTMTLGCSDELHRRYVTRLLGDGELSAEGDGIYKLGADPRVTRLGRVLRRTSLDELPQLFNVLGGDMSLVGPRPMLPWEFELLAPEHHVRFAVPAGLTGLWQAGGRSALTMAQALDLDVQYVRTGGLWLDLRIMVRTVGVLLLPQGRAR